MCLIMCIHNCIDFKANSKGTKFNNIVSVICITFAVNLYRFKATSKGTCSDFILFVYCTLFMSYSCIQVALLLYRVSLWVSLLSLYCYTVVVN